jgi:hypothetical protein
MLHWGFSEILKGKWCIRLNHQPKGTWKNEGLWEEVHVQVGTTPDFVFGHVVFVFLEFLFVPLEVLDHKVLAH